MPKTSELRWAMIAVSTLVSLAALGLATGCDGRPIPHELDVQRLNIRDSQGRIRACLSTIEGGGCATLEFFDQEGVRRMELTEAVGPRLMIYDPDGRAVVALEGSLVQSSLSLMSGVDNEAVDLRLVRADPRSRGLGIAGPTGSLRVWLGSVGKDDASHLLIVDEAGRRAWVKPE